MSQAELLNYIKKKGKWVVMAELSKKFGVRQQNIARQIKKLNQYGYIEIIVDGKRRMIRYNKDKSKEKRRD